MQRISDFKMGATSKRNFKMFRELCGESSLKNVLIVTNMWSEVKPEIGEARESELASKDKFFKPVIEKGARMLRHDGTLESAHTTLRYLLNSHSATLAIQQEIVNEQKPIEKTAAGSELRRTLNEQADRNKEEIRNLRAEMEAAMRAKREERRGELQRELEKKRQECERVEQNSQSMAAEFAAELARLEAQIVQMNDKHKKQLQALEALQGSRVQSEKQHEFLHIRKKSEILATKGDEDERQTRELEEERKARALAKESHQTRLQSLLEDMEMTRTAKEVEDMAHAKEVKPERETKASFPGPSSLMPEGSTPPILPPSPPQGIPMQRLTRPPGLTTIQAVVPTLLVATAAAAIIAALAPNLILSTVRMAFKLPAYVRKLKPILNVLN
jgi:hypothetical protein